MNVLKDKYLHVQNLHKIRRNFAEKMGVKSKYHVKWQQRTMFIRFLVILSAYFKPRYQRSEDKTNSKKG
jgi:hypothetical protein